MDRRTATLARVAMAAGMLAGLASPARAQSLSGAIASGSVAAAVDGVGADVAVAGALGFRFNSVMGLGVEVSWMNLKTTLPPSVAAPSTSIVFSNAQSDALFFTTNVRIDVPRAFRGMRPYGVGGGGPVSMTQRVTITQSRPGSAPIPPDTQIQTSTGLGLTLGGGVSLLATDHVSVDLDIRTFYIRGDSSGSIARFGVGASYRF